MFYATKGGIALGGNNEDYSDPNTGMFIIPGRNCKNGWIKFGFLGGFPQGGMNEKGLFYDATGCAYLPMPASEAEKQLYDGPLMQKVMEECGTVQEALAVFSDFYCEDQYRAQYLIGDAAGMSIIVEGDNIIVKEKHYQVLTNFYQSHPELGGYPCWRYNTAVSILEDASDITPRLFGEILSATHQEGRYPTRYSNIYDLNRQIVYVFHSHNYDEFISVDLIEELGKGQRTYTLSQLFSKMKIINPANEAVTSSASVTFEWTGQKDSMYKLYCSTDPEMADCTPIQVTGDSLDSNPILMACIGSFLLGIASIGKRRSRRAFLLLLLASTLSCGESAMNPDNDGNISFSATVENLQPDTDYFWKVVASTQNGSPFTNETPLRTFKTSG